MKPEVTTDNRIFIYAFAGVIFFIAALGFVLNNFSGILTLQLSNVIVAGLLDVASLSLLYKAIKNDKERLRQI